MTHLVFDGLEGLKTEGLFRESGDSSEVEQLRNAFDSGEGGQLDFAKVIVVLSFYYFSKKFTVTIFYYYY